MKGMFNYQETDNRTTRARIDSDNIMEDSERSNEIINHGVGIEKISEEEDVESEEDDDD